MNDVTTHGTGTSSLRTLAGRALVWPACLALVVAHFAWADEDYAIQARLYSGLLGCLALLTVAYAPRKTFPALAISSSYFYFALGTPVFKRGVTFSVSGPIRLSSRALEDATLGALLYAAVAIGITLLMQGTSAKAGPALARAASDPSPYGPGHTRAIRGMALFSVLVHTVLLMGVHLGSLQQPLMIVGSPAVSLPLLLWDAEQTKSLGSRVVFWLAVAQLGFVGLISGMLGEALLPGIYAGALLWAARSQLPGSLLVAGVVVLLILNPAKHTFRELTWYARDTSVFDRAGKWVEALEITYGGDRGAGVDESLQSTSSRVNTLGQVAHIFEWVPERVPFAGSERWLALPMLLVPRLLWAEKPIQEQYYNKDYTHTFNLQPVRQTGGTSITLPSVGDGYWRLGWAGVLLEAMVVGILLGFSQGISRTPSIVTLLISAALLNLRSDYHVFGILGGSIQSILVAFVIAWAVPKAARLFAPGPQAVPIVPAYARNATRST